MVCWLHVLSDVEQMLSNVELMLELEGVVLAPGPNWDVAARRELVQDERLASLSSDCRNDKHPELISEGMSPLEDEVEDWARAAAATAEMTTRDFIERDCVILTSGRVF